LPTEIPVVWGFNVAKTATRNSGKDVEKATMMNPVFVFPKPVTLANLTELVMARLLAFIRIINATKRVAMLPIIPNCSNNYSRTRL
jgi:hypothetical protein